MLYYCNECKKALENDKFFVLESNKKRFCSHACMMKYATGQKESDDRNKLYDTIIRIFRFETIPPRILAEVKRFKEKEGLSYRNIDAVLHYMYDVREMEPYGETIYKVPLFKEEAKEWYLKNKNRANQIVQEDKIGNKIIPNYSSKKKVSADINPEEV